MSNKAEFLWPFEDGSIEEAGYEFANGQTEGYLREWWEILCERIKDSAKPTEAQGGEER